MTPAVKAILVAVPGSEGWDSATAACAEAAVEVALRRHALGARELDLLVKLIDFAIEWPVKIGLSFNDRATARDLVFRLRQMATRAT